MIVGGDLRRAAIDVLPSGVVDRYRAEGRHRIVVELDRDAFTITRSLPHGHVAAALGTARNTVVTAITPDYPLTVLTRATPLQRQAFTLLGLALEPVAPHQNLGLSLPISHLRFHLAGGSP